MTESRRGTSEIGGPKPSMRTNVMPPLRFVTLCGESRVRSARSEIRTGWLDRGKEGTTDSNRDTAVYVYSRTGVVTGWREASEPHGRPVCPMGVYNCIWGPLRDPPQTYAVRGAQPRTTPTSRRGSRAKS